MRVTGYIGRRPRTLASAGAGLTLLLAGVSARAAPVIGQPAPALVATTVSGASLDLTQWRGKVVLVNFWATWCVPCRREMPVLDAFYQRHHAEGLEVVSVSVDFVRDLEKVRVAAASLAYPVVHLAALTSDGFGRPNGVPVTYLIDAAGVVRDKFIAVPETLLDDVVLPLLQRR